MTKPIPNFSTRRFPRPAPKRVAHLPPQPETTAVAEQSSAVKAIHPYTGWRRRTPATTNALLSHHWEQLKRMHPRLRGLGELPEQFLVERRPQQPDVFDPTAGFYDDWENLYTASTFPFVIGINSQQIIPANPRRTYLLVQNKSAGNFYVNFGQGAAPFSGVKIRPSGAYDFAGGERGGAFAPGDGINVVGDAANLTGIIVEGVKLAVGPATE